MPITRINRRVFAGLPLPASLAQHFKATAASKWLPNTPYTVDLPFRPSPKTYRWGFTLSFKLLVLVALLAAMAWSTAPRTSTLQGNAEQAALEAQVLAPSLK
ncbi:MAG TPA: hypothetical protein VIC26_15255 [Marinagarivorans sp.]